MFQSRKKRNQKILESYKKIKETAFDFDRIVLYFLNKDKTDAHQVISDSTFQDLDFEELFMYLDRTCSSIGQQYLYATLRTIPRNQNRSLYFEKIIKYLDENPDIKTTAILELSKLNEPRAYFLQRLIYGDNIEKPEWFWAVPLLSFASIASLLLSFFFPAFAALFIVVLLANFVIHYWNKKNIFTYSNSITQLLMLNQVAEKMLKSRVFLDNHEPIQKSVNAIGKISRLAIFFKLESRMSSEIGQIVEYLVDLIKTAFLLEPILIFRIIEELETKKNEISTLFTAVAQIDVAISIASFRETLPYFSIPDMGANQKTFYAEEIYHPLIPDAVANDIDISDGKSVLISGSNMSGKTTFIRTMGINAILSQTINTACAKTLAMPVLKVHSAIRISDNLMDETSYYYKEVKTIKHMIEESESAYANLFLLDELFKGTNTIERIASGKAVLDYLNQANNLVFSSTHDLELTELLHKNYNYYHFADLVQDDLLTFDYKLKSGKLANTNAIKILEINSFPKEITEEAKMVANQINEQKKSNSVKNL